MRLVLTQGRAQSRLPYSAAAVILVHNHPSADPEASNVVRRIVVRLKKTLGLMDIRMMDHVVVGSDGLSVVTL